MADFNFEQEEPVPDTGNNNSIAPLIIAGVIIFVIMVIYITFQWIAYCNEEQKHEVRAVNKLRVLVMKKKLKEKKLKKEKVNSCTGQINNIGCHLSIASSIPVSQYHHGRNNRLYTDEESIVEPEYEIPPI
mmetsp:Transcript_99686/g.121910  ORF Transcript_99686/g.121910 Transcript_99686/m.121910 type:complete len:131 (+) Transcript_99686:69-461(+)